MRRVSLFSLLLIVNGALGQEPILQGLMGGPKQFTVFATSGGSTVIALDTIGQKIGPYELVAVDVAQGYADFSKDSKTTRIWLGEGHTKPLSPTSPGNFVRIPLPEIGKIKRLSFGGGFTKDDPRAMKALLVGLDHMLNNPEVSLEDRQKVLAKLLSGDMPLNIVGGKPVNLEEAAAAGWTPEQVADMNRMKLLRPPKP